MRWHLLLAFSLIPGLGSASSDAASHDPLAPLDFLIGTWKHGAAGMAGTDQFQRDLDGKILQRRSVGRMVGTNGRIHRSMRAYLTIYPSADYKGFDALYLDNLGHVILYNEVSVVAGRSVQLTSAGSAAAPSFRLTYTMTTPARLRVTLERARPGRPGVYQAIEDSEESRAE